jgi:heme-degrading monooxygenase HmoA
VSHYEIPEEQRTDAEASFEEALGKISETPGLQDAYFLLSCEGSRAMVITIWENRHAMTDSRVAASRLRTDAARTVDGEVVSVDEYEIVTHAVGATV